MKTYLLEVPIAGYMSVEVDAETEDEARQKALQAEFGWDDIIEITAYERIAQGNVLNTSRNEIVVVSESEAE